MRACQALAAALMLIGMPAQAQDDDDLNAAARRGAQSTDPRKRCATLSGIDAAKCKYEAKQAAARAPGVGAMSGRDGKLVSQTRIKAQAQVAAGDFAGAAATYAQAIEAAGAKSAALPHLTAGLAIAQRRQAVAAYNSGPQPTYPGANATNAEIRAANAANAKLQADRTAATLPLVRTALESAVRAATLAEAGKDRSLDEAIGVELREDAGLLYRLDPDAVLRTPRASIDTEVAWFTRWFDATTPLAHELAAKFGCAIAAALTAKDKAAGLALAEKVRARTGNDVDGLLGYADVVVAAGVPRGDPRRARALSDLTAAEPTVGNYVQLNRLKRLKAALAATS